MTCRVGGGETVLERRRDDVGACVGADGVFFFFSLEDSTVAWLRLLAF